MVALLDGQPKLLNLKQALTAFLAHRREVVTRRTAYDLRKAREKAHLQEGLAVALSNVDEIIAHIKAARTPAEAKQGLMGKHWRSQLVTEMLARAPEGATQPADLGPNFGLTPDGYRLSDPQAQRILEMQLQRLTGLEQEKILADYKELLDTIAELLDILSKPARITAIIGDELAGIKTQYGDKRRSEIVLNAEDIAVEDLIAPQDVVVTFSHAGYIKAQPVADYRAQRRGGRGRQAASMREDDFIERLFIAHTHDSILCFSNRGQVYWLKGYEVPAGTRSSRGKPIVNLFPLAEGERISAVLPVKTFDEDRFIFMATANGTVKKTPLSDFSRPREKGIIAVDLEEGDYLVGASITDGRCDVMLFSDDGKAVRFVEDDVRPMGRVARGVRGMKLGEGSRVISMVVADSEAKSVLTATENGYGKRTAIAEYPRYGRGTQGVIAIQTSERNGKVVSAALVDEKDEIVLVSTGGVLIRTKVDQIREMGRSTQGVSLISLDEGTKLAGVEKIAEPEDDNGNGNGNGDGEGNGSGDGSGDGERLPA
jgi:DNA gyrase subunit A